MISKIVINGKEIMQFSIAQTAARVHRSSGRLRQLERAGKIPQPKYRGGSGKTVQYRMYTLHEVNALAHCFAKYDVKQGAQYPDEFVDECKRLFSLIHRHYESGKNPLPQEALSHAEKV